MSTPRLLDILNKTREFYAEHGIETARVDAEWTLSHALGLSRFDLYLHFDQPLTEADLARIRPLVARRAKREPLAYVLGETDFHDVRLKVDNRVLVPRPETELLVERVLNAHRQAISFLDIGTGSGAIAISLAKALPHAHVTATDISSDALALARENANLSNVQVEFVQSDILASVSGTFDVIVSNPPYVTETEYTGLQPEIVHFEPKIALTAPENGLFFYFRILEQALPFLNPGGTLWFEIGHGQAEAIFRHGEANGWRRDRMFYDDNQFERNLSLQRQ